MNEIVFPDTQHKDIRRKAMDLLARREHSVAELQRKLIDKGYEKAAVDEQLKKLEQENLLNDRRFTESYVRYRSKKGFGPLRIKQELKEKGIGDDLLLEALADHEFWRNLAREVRVKRFGSELPGNYNDKAKQLRFLQYRGFNTDQLHWVFDGE